MPLGETFQHVSPAPEDFVSSGRNKTAPYAVDLVLARGSHTVELCFTQSGADGRLSKAACAPPVAIEVTCELPAAHTCADGAGFGNIIGHPNMCSANQNPVPVHAKGDFGDAPILSITGPAGYTYAAAMDHSGEGCVYQHRWAIAGNPGAGTYAFAIDGNGHHLDFTADLTCR